MNTTNASTYSNPCSRCGTERIVVKKWEEQMYNYPGATKVVHIEKACPNPECQKIIDKELKEQQDKKDNLRRKSEERALARRAKKDWLDTSADE